MIKYAIVFLMLTFGCLGFANEKTNVIQTDLKILCQIKRMEKKLKEDKSLASADVAERLSTIKMAAVKAQETKDALSAVSMADKNDQSKLWKQFAKDNKVKSECL